MNFKPLFGTVLLSGALYSAAGLAAVHEDDEWFFHTAFSRSKTAAVNAPFDMNVHRFTSKAELGTKKFSFGVQTARYIIKDTSKYSFAMPFIRWRYNTQLSNDWSLASDVYFATPKQRKIHIRRSYDLIHNLHFDYRLNSDYTLKLGTRYQLTYVLKEIFPYLVISYRSKNDKGFSFNFGYPEMSATYRFNDDLSVDMGIFGYKYVSYMDDGSFTHTIGKMTVVQPLNFMMDDSLFASAMLIYEPVDSLKLEFGGGWNFHHYVKFYLEDGSQLASFRQNSGFMGYFRASWYF